MMPYDTPGNEQDRCDHAEEHIDRLEALLAAVRAVLQDDDAIRPLTQIDDLMRDAGY